MSEPTDGVGTDPTAQPQGVEPEEGTTAQPQGVGGETPGTTAEGGEPQPAGGKPQVNLDDLPQFRQWKSAYDSRMAEMEKQAAEAKRQATELASQLDELRVRDMPLDEQAAFYRTKLAQERAQMQKQNEELQQRQQYAQEAADALAEMGLDPNTPGLDWSEGPSAMGMVRLMRSAARIVAEQNRQARAETQEKTEEQVREARIGALNDAGVTRTSTATAGAPPQDNPIANIKDPNELLRMGTKQHLQGQERQPPRG